MEDKEKSTREELMDVVKENVNDFWEFLKPNPTDHIILKIVKTILKTPVALFIVMVSPVLLVLLGIIFVILI